LQIASTLNIGVFTDTRTKLSRDLAVFGVSSVKNVNAVADPGLC